MIDEAKVQRILEDFDLNLTPEEICGEDQELLSVVRPRWERMRRMKCQVDEIFPAESERRTRAWMGGTALPHVDGYEIKSILGQGGMGVVFMALDKSLDRFVALKMLLVGQFASDFALTRFRREARAIAALRHPNIVQIHDFGESEACQYFTMECIEGGTLAQKLNGHQQSVRYSAELMATIGHAVQFAHQSGFLHRDLKPGNILMASDGMPKISDFGLARPIFEETELTMTGERVGTLCYMAPEQLLGKTSAIGPCVDIYALGAILYEMLTGRVPFKADNRSETERQIIHDKPMPLSRFNKKVPRDLETICQKCLHKNPSRRYASAQDLTMDLHRFLDGRPVIARPVGVVERTIKWARRRPNVAVFILAIAILIGGGVWFLRREFLNEMEMAARRSNSISAVNSAVSGAFSLGKLGRLHEAKLLLTEAKSHLPLANSQLSDQQVGLAEMDLNLAQRLSDVRDHAEEVVLEVIDSTKQDADVMLIDGYRKTFEEAGITIEDDPERMANRIRSSELRNVFIAALDRWALSAFVLDRETEPEKVLRIARRADSESEERNMLRDSTKWGDAKQLREMVRAVAASAVLPSSDTYAILATLLDKQQAHSESLDLLNEAVRRYPTDYWSNWEIAKYHLRELQYADAVGYLHVLNALHPNQAPIISRLGIALVQAGQNEAGIGYMRQAASSASDNDRIQRRFMLLLTRVGRFDDAVEEARKWLEMEPDDSERHYQYGLALSSSGRVEDAVEHFQRAVELQPNHVDAARSLANWLQKIQRNEQAADAFRRVLENNNSDPVGHNGLAVTLSRSGRHEEAIKECEWLIRELDPKKLLERRGVTKEIVDEKYAIARLIYASSLFHLARFAEAKAATQAFLALPPNVRAGGQQDMKDQLRKCEKLLLVEPFVKQLLNGDVVFARESEQDRSIAESMIELADWSQRCNQSSDASVRFYEDAFRRHPPLAEHLLAGYRLFAACAAAEAALAEGSFKLRLNEETRQDFRRKSLKWLRADCDALLKIRMSDSSNDVPNQYLWSLRQAEDLVYLHDPTELAKLEDEERRGWQNLWQDFAKLSEGDLRRYMDEAQHFADTKQWVKAAESYAKAKQLAPFSSEPCYEYAATQLLANDSNGYQATCRSMLTDQSMRPYLIARTFTLAPKALDDLISASHISSEELKKHENQFWSLTERGALAVRMNHADESIKLFRKSIDVESNAGAAVLNWLWLAIAYEKMGNSVEAKSWLHRATRFLDGLGDKRPTDVEFVTLHRHNWFEAHILRREAESMILSK